MKVGGTRLLSWLRRATELQPDSLDYLALLAEAEVDREHFAEAIDCYREIIRRDPGDATAHNALGWLLQEEGQLELSAEHLRTALRLQPDLAVANVTLGSLHEKTGDFAAAEACFRTAVNDDAARSHALARLAMLLRGKLPDDDCKAIEERLADSNANDPARLNLFFGLANVWDARGVMLKQPPAHGKPTPLRWPSFSGETWYTIRPSTSGSFQG